MWTWFAGTGLAGPVIVALTVVLVAAGAAAAVVRAPRGAAIALLAGALLPLLLGVAGALLGRSATDAVVAQMKAPRDEDRAVGYEEAGRCLTLGVAGMIVADLAAAAALLRARRPEPAP